MRYWLRFAAAFLAFSLFGGLFPALPVAAQGPPVVAPDEGRGDHSGRGDEARSNRQGVGGQLTDERGQPLEFLSEELFDSEPSPDFGEVDGVADVVLIEPGTDGVEVVVGDGEAARVIARLAADGVSTALWTGYGCVTGSGKHVGVVFAPVELVDSDAQDFGAFFATVDLGAGEVSVVDELVALRYHSPGCGAGDLVTASRYVGDGWSTEFVTVDASSGRVSVEQADGRFRFPAPTGSGAVLASGGDVLVEVSTGGDVDVVADGEGQFVDVHVTGDGGADFLLISDDHQVEARSLSAAEMKFSRGNGAKGKLVAQGNLGELKWSTGEDGDNLLVTEDGVDVVDTSTEVLEATGDLPDGVSLDGKVTGDIRVVDDVTQVEIKGSSAGSTAGSRPGMIMFSSQTTEPAVVNDRFGFNGQGVSTAAGMVAAVDLPVADVCAVPVADPTVQVVQPSPEQIEWAVHRVVRGNLDVSRPANWRNNGLGAYSPSAEFPRRAIDGGGRVPAQLLLGILAQESNLWQASRGAIPGVASSPLVGNYYGVRFSNGRVVSVDSSRADCGYGVGQVTDGMRADQAGQTFTAAQQKMIATDYVANIAAAHNILVGKWNQLRAAGLITADMDPAIADNWYLALWAYNSGYNTVESSGKAGLGWTNNPANSDYKFDRMYYLRDSYDDARRPADWSYPERVLGYAENGFFVRGERGFRSGSGVLGLPVVVPDGYDPNASKFRLPVDRFVLCTSHNDCDENYYEGSAPVRYDRSFCTRSDRKCWWNQPAPFLPPPDGSGVTERSSTYTAGEAEPADRRPYPAACAPNDAEMPPFGTLDGIPDNAIIIDDVPAGTPNVAGCSNVKSAGSFDINFADPVASADFNQIGTGYGGHFYRTHTNWETRPDHTITGTWRPPAGTSGWHRVLAHIPTVGADTYQAEYQIFDGSGGDPLRRTVNQRWNQNQWVDLGFANLGSGARIELSNETYSDHGKPIGNTGVADPFYSAGRVINIAWDAVALIPTDGPPDVSYVALGDITAGGDVGVWTKPTNIGSTSSNRENRCRRNANWNQPLVGGVDGSVGTSAILIGCNGARMGDHIVGSASRWGEVPQLRQGWVDSTTTHVSLSAGPADLVAGSGNLVQAVDKLVADTGRALEQITNAAPSAQVILTGVSGCQNAEVARLDGELAGLASTYAGVEYRPTADCGSDPVVPNGKPAVIEGVDAAGNVVYSLYIAPDHVLSMDDFRRFPADQVRKLRLKVGGSTTELDLTTGTIGGVDSSAALLTASGQMLEIAGSSLTSPVRSQTIADPDTSLTDEIVEDAAEINELVDVAESASRSTDLPVDKERKIVELPPQAAAVALSETLESTPNQLILVSEEGQSELQVDFADTVTDGELVGDAVVADAGADHDVVVRPTDQGGAQIAVSIDNADAPTAFEFDLSLGTTSELRVNVDGEIEIVDEDGKVPFIVRQPWAVDANNELLPTRYEIRGTTLIQHVDHAGAAYPVVADPQVDLSCYTVPGSRHGSCDMFLGPKSTARLAAEGSVYLCELFEQRTDTTCNQLYSNEIADAIDKARNAARNDGCLQILRSAFVFGSSIVRAGSGSCPAPPPDDPPPPDDDGGGSTTEPCDRPPSECGGGTGPSDPTEPTDPTGPTDPTEPTDPTGPTDPTEPTDPSGPTDPTGPVGPGPITELVGGVASALQAGGGLSSSTADAIAPSLSADPEVAATAQIAADLLSGFGDDPDEAVLDGLSRFVDEALGVASDPVGGALAVLGFTTLGPIGLGLGLLGTEGIKGCGRAVTTRIVDFASLAWNIAVFASSNDVERVGIAVEAARELKALYDAVARDAEAVAIAFGKELLYYDLYEQGLYKQWAGAIACEIVIEVGLAFATAGVYTAARAGSLGTRIATILNKLDGLIPENRKRPSVCPNNSFPAGTPVLMADGSHVAIELIESGDRVLTYNTGTGVWSANLVLDQWSGVHTDPMVTVTLSDGSTVSSTDDHLFWVSSDGEWVDADELQAGDLLLTPEGVTPVATVTVHDPAPLVVWELDTAVDDTFTVASTGGHAVLVHNCGLDDVPTEVLGRLESDFGLSRDALERLERPDPKRIEELYRQTTESNASTARGAVAELERLRGHLSSGVSVELLSPRKALDGQERPTPDFLVDGRYYDSKATTNTTRGIRDSVNKANTQFGDFGSGQAEIKLDGDLASFGDVDREVRRALGQNSSVDSVSLYDQAGRLVGLWERFDGGVERRR